MFNTELPIYAYHEEILDTINQHPVTIIVAETGAGKSTQVPQFLLDAGQDLVVTQPRRIAARTVAERVAEEYGTPFGEIVGFRTAYESKDSDATRCLFVTDGLAMVRELMGSGNHGILVVDEVHEWNLNVEVMIAWIKLQLKKKAKFKVVLMSATMEAERLSEFFDGAPIINVPGRQFGVEERAPAKPTLEEDVASLLRAGRNVLVFHPGKAEIARTISVLSSMGLNAEILPLHGELSSEEQKKCFESYSRPKCVVTTNVAETSVTINDIDAVVDSGEERRVELVDGIEGLYLKPIALARRRQRKGRAGRTKPGIYIDWCAAAESERLEYPLAEIMRVRLDQTVLRLAEAGFDMEELTFFHQPDRTEIHDAERALKALGCMDEDGRVTRIGHRIAKMPVNVKYGRMIVEAERLGVAGDVMTIAAILEQGGIASRRCEKHAKMGLKQCTCWQALAGGEKASDVIAQLRAYQACEQLSKSEIVEAGIFAKAFFMAGQKRKHLAKALKKFVNDESTGNREAILRAVCAGMVDHLYQFTGGELKDADGEYRKLSHDSVVSIKRDRDWPQNRNGDWIVGHPFDIEFKGRYGDLMKINSVNMATLVKPSWLIEVAPQLVERRTGLNPRFNADLNEVVSTTETLFNGHLLTSEEVKDPNHEKAQEVIRTYINDTQWTNWARPAIEPLDLSAAGAQVPPVHVESYGTDGLTNEPLQAYGTHAVVSGSWFTVRTEVFWTTDKVEAERRRDELVRRLPDALEHIRRNAEAEERNALMGRFLDLREKLSVRMASQLFVRLTETLISQAHNVSLTSRFAALGSIRESVSTMERLLPSIDAEFRQLEAEAEKLLPTAVERRNRVRELMSDQRFTQTWVDELYHFVDPDAMLPQDPRALQAWIGNADAMIARAEQYLKELPADGGVGADMLAALQGRFNQR